MFENSYNYLKKYIPITEELTAKVRRHAKRYPGLRVICAWYADWEDFCYDWCDSLGYTRTEARKILHGGRGEFLVLPNGQILRFA